MASVTFTIYNSQTLDEDMAAMVLSKLGLSSAQLRQEFVASYKYVDLLSFFAGVINLPRNAVAYANIVRDVKKYGKVTVNFGVDDKLVSDVEEFLKIRAQKLKDRKKDGDEEMDAAGKSTAEGAKKNLDEAADDVDKGLGQMITGLGDELTAPVGSEKFKEGMTNDKAGLLRFGRGLFKFYIQTPLDAGLMGVGAEIDRAQTLLNLENIGRSLNLTEMKILREVFGQSLVLEAIKIKEGYAGIYNIGKDTNAQNETTYFHNHRALTRGNTIYMKYLTPGSDDWFNTLVHEATHVWQCQNGGTDYISEALYAQIFGDGYDYETAITAQNKTWAMLNPEQQAHLIEEAYASGFLINGVPNGKWIDPNDGRHRPDFEQFFVKQNILGQLRSGQGAT